MRTLVFSFSANAFPYIDVFQSSCLWFPVCFCDAIFEKNVVDGTGINVQRDWVGKKDRKRHNARITKLFSFPSWNDLLPLFPELHSARWVFDFLIVLPFRCFPFTPDVRIKKSINVHSCVRSGKTGSAARWSRISNYIKIFRIILGNRVKTRFFKKKYTSEASHRNFFIVTR